MIVLQQVDEQRRHFVNGPSVAAGMSSCPRTLRRGTRPMSRSQMRILISIADADDVYVINSCLIQMLGMFTKYMLQLLSC